MCCAGARFFWHSTYTHTLPIQEHKRTKKLCLLLSLSPSHTLRDSLYVPILLCTRVCERRIGGENGYEVNRMRGVRVSESYPLLLLLAPVIVAIGKVNYFVNQPIYREDGARKSYGVHISSSECWLRCEHNLASNTHTQTLTNQRARACARSIFFALALVVVHFFPTRSEFFARAHAMNQARNRVYGVCE